MEIKIGIGIGPLIFGMKQVEIEAILGKPNKIRDEINLHSTSWIYNREMIILNFDKTEDLKLVSIDISKPAVCLFGERMIGETKEHIKVVLAQNGYNNPDQEDYGAFETLTFWEIGIECEFQINHLTSLSFWPLITNSDDIAWPERLDNELPFCFVSFPEGEHVMKSYGHAREILIGIGMEGICFGMTTDEVEVILGKPDKVITEEIDDVYIYEYFAKLFRIKLDINKVIRVYSIEIHDQSSTLLGHYLFGKSMQQMLALLKLWGCKQIKYTEFDTSDVLWCEELQMTFSFTFDRLSEIEFSPLRDINEHWIWPERKSQRPLK